MSGSNIADLLIHTTVRIATASETAKGSGTGFFLSLCNDGRKNVPVIVTNKHVVEGSVEGEFRFTRGQVASPGEDLWEPDIGKFLDYHVSNFSQHWIMHPDPSVDLAVFPIAGLMEHAKASGQPVYYRAFTTPDIADEPFFEGLTAIEDVLMVGYPIGLFDTANNHPIVRRGLTATPPSARFEGRNEFMIDCACFPGSSGSPIVLYNQFGHFDKSQNSFMMGQTRIKLLGVLWGGPQYTSVGEVRAVPVPTQMPDFESSTRIPTNLGYCIRASELRWFEEHFKSIFEKQNQKMKFEVKEGE